MSNRSKAKLEILSHVFQFKIARMTPDGSPYNHDNECFISDVLGDDSNTPIGTLVSVFCAPTSKFYLSWLREIKENKSGYHQFLLESIEDGELCWWENVSLVYLPLEYVNKYPKWKWTDEQFDFCSKWYKAAYDNYSISPLLPVFLDNGSVILKVRYKWGIKDEIPEREFKNWKKLTIREMKEFSNNIK